jgi:hypothetical protein
VHPWLASWGQEIPIGDLALAEAVAFVEYVNRFGHNIVTLRGARRRPDNGAEVVVLELTTDVPQKPHVDIRHTEPLAILFPSSGLMPIVLSLRSDFPDTEHQQLVPDGVPCGVCIDDRPWAEARTTWTPAEFLERISLWFHRAARGELHDPAQPLDPFFGVSEYSFIFPRSALVGTASAELAFFASEANPKSFITMPMQQVTEAAKKNIPRFTTVAYSVPHEKMTRLRNAPSTLGSLDRALFARGVDLAADLRARMKEWYGAKAQDAGRLGSPVAIIIEFPIMTPAGKLTDMVDTRAFVPGCTLGGLGVAIGALYPAANDQGSRSGYAPVLLPGVKDQSLLDAIPLEVANVHIEFDQERAAELAGLPKADTRKAVMIGAGAIGSQNATILAREGRFTWTVIDDDRLLPHNLARHSLEFRHQGQRKALALAQQIDRLRPRAEASARHIICDLTLPGEHEAALNEALNEADIIIDASASVAAERFIADHGAKARRASVFFNPAGEAVVVLAEPSDRRLTLRDLEAQYYRAVLRQPELEQHLAATGERFAYTGACRALTNRIPQSRAALLSALSAAALANMLDQSSAGAGIWTLQPDLSVIRTTPSTSPVTHTQLLDWTVTIDEQLTQEIQAIRGKSLPAETGGVLLGVVDAAAKKIHIVEALSAPKDSVEEATGFERGVAGLEPEIRSAMARTMDQVRYVGEWHSHPPRYSTDPSGTDLKQIGWLATVLAMENRPGVMLIAGDYGINLLTGVVCKSGGEFD